MAVYIPSVLAGAEGQVPTVQADGQVVMENPSGTPTGSAGGVLSGTYPNPTFAADMATQAELNAHTHPYGNQVCLTEFIEQPTRAGQQDMHGFFGKIVNAGALSSGVPLAIDNGIGKIVFAIIAGSDVAGTMTVTGTSVNRNTGAETALDTDVITVDGATTDSSAADAEGNQTYGFTNAYITSKWFKGAVTLSTTNLTLTDVDVYAIAFEQFGDNTNLVVNALDITGYNSGVAEWLYAYLYKVEVTGSVVDIASIASVSLNPAPVAARSYRLRKGALAVALDGSTDGIFLDLFLGPAPVGDWSDLTLKVWATINSTSSVLA